MKHGFNAGRQRYFCANCHRHSVLPIARRSTSPKSLYEEYVKGKQTRSEIAERHGLSVSTVQRRMRQVHSTRIISKYKEVVILMDATYWGRSFGVLLIVDAYRKRLLWRKFLDKKETIADYLEGIEWLRKHKFKILGIVSMDYGGYRKLSLDTRCYIVSFIKLRPLTSILQRILKQTPARSCRR